MKLSFLGFSKSPSTGVGVAKGGHRGDGHDEEASARGLPGQRRGRCPQDQDARIWLRAYHARSFSSARGGTSPGETFWLLPHTQGEADDDECACGGSGSWDAQWWRSARGDAILVTGAVRAARALGTLVATSAVPISASPEETRTARRMV